MNTYWWVWSWHFKDGTPFEIWYLYSNIGLFFLSFAMTWTLRLPSHTWNKPLTAFFTALASWFLNWKDLHFLDPQYNKPHVKPLHLSSPTISAPINQHKFEMSWISLHRWPFPSLLPNTHRNFGVAIIALSSHNNLNAIIITRCVRTQIFLSKLPLLFSVLRRWNPFQTPYQTSNNHLTAKQFLGNKSRSPSWLQKWFWIRRWHWAVG